MYLIRVNLFHIDISYFLYEVKNIESHINFKIDYITDYIIGKMDKQVNKLHTFCLVLSLLIKDFTIKSYNLWINDIFTENL